MGGVGSQTHASHTLPATSREWPGSQSRLLVQDEYTYSEDRIGAASLEKKASKIARRQKPNSLPKGKAAAVGRRAYTQAHGRRVRACLCDTERKPWNLNSSCSSASALSHCYDSRWQRSRLLACRWSSSGTGRGRLHYWLPAAADACAKAFFYERRRNAAGSTEHGHRYCLLKGKNACYSLGKDRKEKSELGKVELLAAAAACSRRELRDRRALFAEPYGESCGWRAVRVQGKKTVRSHSSCYVRHGSHVKDRRPLSKKRCCQTSGQGERRASQQPSACASEIAAGPRLSLPTERACFWMALGIKSSGVRKSKMMIVYL